MRTISVRLDERTDALLRLHCEQHGLTQPDAIRAAIELMMKRHKATPAELAGQLGLIGCFGSGDGHLATEHSGQVKQRALAKLRRDQAGFAVN